MFLVDSHCHLDLLHNLLLHKNIKNTIDKAIFNEVKLFLCVSTSLSNFNLIFKKMNFYKNVFFSCGVHPLNIEYLFDFHEFKKLSNNNRVIALGETGLDYLNNVNKKIKQQEMFYKHISLSKELKKPLIIHTRSSDKDLINILSKEKKNLCGGVLHSFTGNIHFAKILLDLGFFISFSGIITFKNSTNIQIILRYIPLNRILIETDSPYLTPVPFRGKQNNPSYLRNIAEYIAILKNVSLLKISKITTNNFCKLFNVNI